MSTELSTPCLVLYPGNPEWQAENSDTVLGALRETGLIAEAWQPQCFLVGERFLEHIAFMGCSPSINLAPQSKQQPFCHVRLITSETLTAVTSTHSYAPRCPHCKQAVKNWPTTLTATTLPCSNCGEVSAPWLYNWRKSAGFGHCFIQITQVYPGEAIPQQTLLDDLEQLTGTRWKHCYLR